VQPLYRLDKRERRELYQLRKSCTEPYEGLGAKDLLEGPLESVRKRDREAIEKATARGIFDAADLREIAGYLDFAKQVGVSTSDFPLELRIEGDRAYLLTSLDRTLLRTLDGRALSYSMTKAHAEDMFGKKDGDFTIGDPTRATRFATPCEVGSDPFEVIQGLGLQGYGRAREPLSMVEMKPELVASLGLDPKVPIIYKMRGPDGVWRTRENFGKGVPRGFASGGMAEVVFSRKTAKATSFEALEDAGLAVKTLRVDTVKPERRKIVLTHINDVHSRVENLAKHGALIEQLRQKHDRVAVLCAGDLFEGTVFFNFYHGALEVRLLNEMGFDAMVLGNHETAKGMESMKDVLSRANFELVTANLEPAAASSLSDINSVYTVKDYGGVKVGFFGLTTMETHDPDRLSKSIALDDFQGCAQRVADELEAQGIDIVVMLAHERSDIVRDLVPKLRGVDVVIGGHDHHEVGEILRDADGHAVFFGEAGADGHKIGVMELVFDQHGHVVVEESSARLEETKDLKSHPELLRIVEAYRRPIEDEMKRVVLLRAPEVRADFPQIAGRESHMGNFVSDAILAGTKEIGAEIALVHAGMLRQGLPKGTWTNRELYEAFPYDARAAVVSLSPDQIKAVLEAGVSAYEDDRSLVLGSGFITGAGLRYAIDLDADPGSRIQKIEVERHGRWTKLDRPLEVAVPDFILNGGMNMPLGAWLKAGIIEPKWQDEPIRDLVVQYASPRNIRRAEVGRSSPRISGGTSYERWLRRVDHRRPGTFSSSLRPSPII
jgi:5'-nucleotidase / UDP-sugar diphosphatase